MAGLRPLDRAMDMIADQPSSRNARGALASDTEEGAPPAPKPYALPSATLGGANASNIEETTLDQKLLTRSVSSGREPVPHMTRSTVTSSWDPRFGPRGATVFLRTFQNSDCIVDQWGFETWPRNPSVGFSG